MAANTLHKSKGSELNYSTQILNQFFVLTPKTEISQSYLIHANLWNIKLDIEYQKIILKTKMSSIKFVGATKFADLSNFTSKEIIDWLIVK